MKLAEMCEPDTESCTNVVCDSIPSAHCVDATALREYAAPGTCEDGTCYFDFTDTVCHAGCADDACTVPVSGCEGYAVQEGSPWPIPHACPTRDGVAAVTGPLDPIVAWEVAVQSASRAPTIAADGTLYVSGRELVALRPDGNQGWFRPLGFPGSSLLTGDGAIVIPDNDSILHGLEADGSTRWTYDTQDADLGGSPTVDSAGNIYVAGHSTLYALSSEGQLRWTFEHVRIKPVPVIARDGTVYVAADESLYAFNGNGSGQWVHHFDRMVHGTPVLAADGSLVVATNSTSPFEARDFDIRALSPGGEELWVRQTSIQMGISSVATDGTILTVSRGDLHAFSSDGTPLWTNHTGIRSGGALIDANGNIFISGSGVVLAFDSAGDELWNLRHRNAGPALSFGADDTLYTVGNNIVSAITERP